MGRKLSELFQVGKEVLINDNTGGEPARVYIRKLSPNDQEKALRRANAARATVLAKKNTPEDEEWQVKFFEAQEMSREEKIRTLIGQDILKYRMSREAELEHDEESEWGKEGYLQSLRDSWDDVMAKRYAEDPEDVEALQVRNELQRFMETVDVDVKAEEASRIDSWSDIPDDKVDEKIVGKLLELDADAAWLKEFRRCEIWLAVRDPDDKKSLYFESRDEVTELPIEVITRLMAEYQSLIVDPQEGKDSRPPVPSSELSEPTVKEATEQDSGQLSVVP